MRWQLVHAAASGDVKCDVPFDSSAPLVVTRTNDPNVYAPGAQPTDAKYGV